MGRGRPKLGLDEGQIANYAKLGASNREIASMLGCDESVIRRQYAALLEKSRSERRTMIRKMQWDCAKEGNPTMLIWLGKNELGQSDKQTIEHGGEIKATPKQSIDVEKFVIALATELERRSQTTDIVSERDNHRQPADTDHPVSEATGLPE